MWNTWSISSDYVCIVPCRSCTAHHVRSRLYGNMSIPISSSGIPRFYRSTSERVRRSYCLLIWSRRTSENFPSRSGLRRTPLSMMWMHISTESDTMPLKATQKIHAGEPSTSDPTRRATGPCMHRVFTVMAISSIMEHPLKCCDEPSSSAQSPDPRLKPPS